MKFRFYIGISLAVFFGLILASSVMMGFSYVSEKIDIELPKISFGSAGTTESWEENIVNLEIEGDIVDSYESTIFWGNESGRYEKISENIPFPSVSAESYVVADIHTGEVIVSRNRYRTQPIASISKLMTALVAIEYFDLNNIVSISREAVSAYGKQGGLRIGEEMSLDNLLYPLLLESSNDAAEAIARYKGRDIFIDNMNNMAQEIGLVNTSFEDPSGLSYNNVSTVDDILKLSRYIHQNNGNIFSITREKEYEYANHTWFSNSRFRNDDGYVGGKNGYTDEANHTIVSIFDLPLEINGKRRVAIILLKSEDTEDDVNKILLYLLKNIYYDSE